MTKERDYKIDWIRAIASVLVILAHTDAPMDVHQIRTFDIVALVFISGMTLGIGTQPRWTVFLKKRIRKLLLPTYLTLFVVYAANFAAHALLSVEQGPLLSKFLPPLFLLSSGYISYVWIARVQLAIAISSPLIFRLTQSAQGIKKPLLLLSAGILAGGLLYVIGQRLPRNLMHTVYFDYVYTDYVYILIAAIGCWFARNRHKRGVYPSLLAGSLILLLVIQGYLMATGAITGFDVASYAFPPRLYLCVYGVAVTLLLYKFLPNRFHPVIHWLSVNSYTTFLWHILVLQGVLLAAKLPPLAFLGRSWQIKFVLVLAGTLLCTFLGKWLRSKVTFLLRR